MGYKVSEAAAVLVTAAVVLTPWASASVNHAVTAGGAATPSSSLLSAAGLDRSLFAGPELTEPTSYERYRFAEPGQGHLRRETFGQVMTMQTHDGRAVHVVMDVLAYNATPHVLTIDMLPRGDGVEAGTPPNPVANALTVGATDFRDNSGGVNPPQAPLNMPEPTSAMLLLGGLAAWSVARPRRLE